MAIYHLIIEGATFQYRQDTTDVVRAISLTQVEHKSRFTENLALARITAVFQDGAL